MEHTEQKISLKSSMTVSSQKVYKRILDSLMSSVHRRIQGVQSYKYGQVYLHRFGGTKPARLFSDAE
jgi:hypothetical protein